MLISSLALDAKLVNDGCWESMFAGTQRIPPGLSDSMDYLRSLTPFLPATVFRGPLRVRAFVRVR